MILTQFEKLASPRAVQGFAGACGRDSDFICVPVAATRSARSRPVTCASTSLGLACVGALLLLLAAGCAVPQPRGEGVLTREVEPIQKRGYWQYLPKDYVQTDDAGRRGRRWPLVVTFHGMKPFDNAHPQALEWQQEADRYGYLVIAPELRAPDMFAEFPLRNVHPAFKGDEEAVLAVLDHVFANTYADAKNVLSTSWSSGGYMAHYMMNRHPERFTALAVRQSNFSRHVLDPVSAGRGINHPVLIVNTENDFKICKDESRDAVNWYTERGYPNVAWVYIRDLGHERTPDLAAAFFARVAGAEAAYPPTVLVQRQAIDGNARGLAFLAGKAGPAKAAPSADVLPQPRRSPERPALAQKPVTAPPRQRSSETPAYLKSGGSKPVPVLPVPQTSSTAREPVLVRSPSQPPPREPAAPAGNSSARLVSQTPTGTVSTISDPLPTPARSGNAGSGAAAAALRRSPIAIRVSSGVGVEPLTLGFAAECPSDWHRTADFHWSLNGEAIGSGLMGQKTIVTAGDHTLTLMVVTADGVEHSAAQVVRVLPKSMLGNASASTR